ncbi:hypothetical protein PsorP6_018993 [Peronosclerospora sorghi]|nr:hypothetical protein PsorP6_018993 [Peronosclerospora sorghi]
MHKASGCPSKCSTNPPNVASQCQFCVRFDFYYLLLKGCVNLGSVPDRSDWFFDMTPLDYAARAIVHFAASRPVEALGQPLLIQNPSLPVKRRLLRVLYCCNRQQEVGNDGFYGMEAQSAPRCQHRDCSIGVKKNWRQTLTRSKFICRATRFLT